MPYPESCGGRYTGCGCLRTCVMAAVRERHRPVSRRTWIISLNRWMFSWRARLSVPSLLASFEERRIISLIAAINGGTAILIISLLAWLIGVPMLFPALGPSAFLLFSAPFSKAAAPRSVILGHLAAIGVGLVVWHAVSFLYGEPLSMGTEGWPVLASASLALALCCVLLVRLSCPHAPACATALIISLGAANDWPALLGMVAGVVLLTGQAVLMNRIAGVAMPTWSHGRISTSDGGL